MNRLAGWIIAALLSCSFDPTVPVYAAGRTEIHWPNAVEILQGGLTEIRISSGALAEVDTNARYQTPRQSNQAQLKLKLMLMRSSSTRLAATS